MKTALASEDPAEPVARSGVGRALQELIVLGSSGRVDPALTLGAWLGTVGYIEDRPLSPTTRKKLRDWHRVSSEFAAVLAGEDLGEGPASQRLIRFAVAGGRIQGISSLFACPRGTFVEFLVTAPWNLLGPRDPRDLRTVRGAGTTLLNDALVLGRRRGCGRIALQAENRRALAFYEHMGFRPMHASDLPFSLVPCIDSGWSPSVVRLAAGRGKSKASLSPWLVLDPVRLLTSSPA